MSQCLSVMFLSIPNIKSKSWSATLPLYAFFWVIPRCLLPRRNYTTFRTRQKFEIKNSSLTTRLFGNHIWTRLYLKLLKDYFGYIADNWTLEVESEVNRCSKILLLPQPYNSLWVLACSIIPLHGFLSCAFCFKLFTPIFLKSSLTPSSHLNLGHPFGLVACGFHL